MSERSIDAITAVKNEFIWKPGTIMLASQIMNTLIRKAVIPKVRIVMGSAMICKIGLRNVLATPITIAATTASQTVVKVNPGIR